MEERKTPSPEAEVVSRGKCQNIKIQENVIIFLFQVPAKKVKTTNPWAIQSIYDLQYFNCPACPYKTNSKQKFVIHIYHLHPEALEDLCNIGKKHASLPLLNISYMFLPFGRINISLKSIYLPQTTLKIHGCLSLMRIFSHSKTVSDT